MSGVPTWARVALALLPLSLLPGAVVQAQPNSREEAIAAEQSRKAAEIQPYTPGKAEQIFNTLERTFIREPSGFFPVFDTVYSGGGFTLGGGYRTLFADDTAIDVIGLYSIKGYKRVETSLRSRGHASGRASASLTAGWRDATQVSYYGVGIDTPADQRASYRMKQTYAGGEAELRPHPWIVLGAGLGYESYTLESGEGSYPSIEQRYTAATAPGLGTAPDYVRASARAALDWRTAADYSRRGGLSEITFSRYADVDDVSSFNDLAVQAVQHIPILRETWILSFRGRLEAIVGSDSNPPYFLLPSLGGGRSIRGYDSWRFRGRNSWLMSGEWRWIPESVGARHGAFLRCGNHCR